ncbi:uncharacterized protein LOC143195140 isoform X2 [Rhynchophorus ferrugineus]|uniref:uncharacterized protein LOC143195140 isoform X2 n=1 Tax=Rhynchophorus ferrugineus TaxID=354439 RepID=UPI003FCD4D78
MPALFNDHGRVVPLVCAVGVVVIGLIYSRIDNGTVADKESNDTVQERLETVDSVRENKSMELVLVHEKRAVAGLMARPPPQPVCLPRNKIEEMDRIFEELINVRLSCKPEDILNPAKHKIPKYYYENSLRNNSTNDTQNTIVNCIIAALLLTSLGAALLEFYRAKISPAPTDNERKGLKPPLNRKCSLADLTVLKHHRKELVRRESILEHHSEDRDGQHQMAKLQGIRPVPLHRRCSFPVNFPTNDGVITGNGLRRNSRKLSMANDLNRRLSIVNDGGRKLSMVTDVLTEDIWRRGSLISGEDSSPERRHHSRLVHRH